MEKITLQQFIIKKGIDGLAKEIGCTRNTVYLWSKFKSAPSFVYASILIKLGRGRLDFESIYRPFYNSPKKKKVK